eukprot:jgi/Mesen1/490/ME001024S10718
MQNIVIMDHDEKVRRAYKQLTMRIKLLYISPEGVCAYTTRTATLSSSNTYTSLNCIPCVHFHKKLGPGILLFSQISRIETSPLQSAAIVAVVKA